MSGSIDAAHIDHQRQWAEATFGPGLRTVAVTAHIAKELDEIRAAPGDLEEWVDVIILALNGACRTGAASQDIIDAIKAKQARNEARSWPDWRTADLDTPIEHVRPSWETVEHPIYVTAPTIPPDMPSIEFE